MTKETISGSVSRRGFLKGAALVGASAAAMAVTGCASDGATEPAPDAADGAADDAASSTASNVPAWEQTPEPITEFAEERSADIIVVGAGVAGMTAAAKASELGSVIVVEKAGAKAMVRECEWAFGARVQKEAGMTFTDEEKERVLANYMETNHWNMTKHDVMRSFIDHSGELVDWIEPILAESGIIVRHEPRYGYYGVSYGTYGFPTEDWFVPLENHTLANGGQYYYNERAVQLVQDETGRVVGVVTEDEVGDHIKYNASKGVILCSGGIGMNLEMMDKWFPRANVVRHRALMYPTHDGDGHIMAMQIGADMDDVLWGDAYLGADTDLPNPPLVINGVEARRSGTDMYTPCVGTLPMLYVDISGHRTVNEAAVYDTPDSGLSYWDGWNTQKLNSCISDFNIANAVLWQPENVMYSIFDSAWHDKLANTVSESSTTSMYPMDLIYNENTLAEDIANGVTYQADTIEELAGMISVDPAVLQATIDRYNELVAKGHDDDFLKIPKWLTSVDTAPYYACPISAQPCCTRGGLKINPYGQVMDKKGNAISGLYAAGLTAGSTQGFGSIVGSVSVTQMFGWLGCQHAHGLMGE